MSHYPELSQDQRRELLKFSSERGRKWKAELEAESWWRGIPMRGFPLLYGLRNTHGSQWLARLKLSSLTLL